MRPTLLALVALTALAGCPGAGTSGWQHRHRKQPRASGPTIEFKPAGEPVERYNDPPLVTAPSSALADALVDAVARTAEANGRAAPLADGRLYAVANDLAAIRRDDDLPPYQAVEFSLAFHGVIEPSPHLVVVAGDQADLAPAVKAIAEKLPEVLGAATFGFTRVGVGAAARDDGKVMIVLALLESGVETEPIPRRVARGGAFSLRGKVLHGYAQPKIFLTVGNGQVVRPPVTRDDAGGFRAQIDCGEGSGKRQVEITGQGPHGVTVLANFPIWCGDEPPRELAVTLPSAADEAVASAGEAERRVFELVNEDRAQAGLAPLVWSDAATRIARTHSEDMHANGFVGHLSPTTGSAADRTRRAGLGTPLVLENVARAFSTMEAEAGFMNSPGHRANLLSVEATHIGIGVVLGQEVAGRRELYVTQLFYRVPPKLERKAGVAAARRALAERREAAGVGALKRDADLDAIAQQFADGLVGGRKSKDQLASTSSRQLEELAERYASVTTILTVIGDPLDLESDGLLDGSMRAYGIGLAQGTDEALGENAIYVVVILARNR